MSVARMPWNGSNCSTNPIACNFQLRVVTDYFCQHLQSSSFEWGCSLPDQGPQSKWVSHHTGSSLCFHWLCWCIERRLAIACRKMGQLRHFLQSGSFLKDSCGKCECKVWKSTKLPAWKKLHSSLLRANSKVLRWFCSTTRSRPRYQYAALTKMGLKLKNWLLPNSQRPSDIKACGSNQYLAELAQQLDHQWPGLCHSWSLANVGKPMSEFPKNRLCSASSETRGKTCGSSTKIGTWHSGDSPMAKNHCSGA